MRMKTPCCALVMLGLALAGSAQAQWKWLDATGQINYSDHPPPLSVPSGRILSQGGSLRAALAAPAAAAASGDAATGAGNDSPQAGAPDAAAATQSAASPAIQAGSSATADAAPADKADGGPARPRTPAERLNALRKQQALKEAAQREAEQKKQAQAGIAQKCDELRGRARLLRSDLRVARIDADGAQSFVSDEERAADLQAITRELETHCTKGS